LAGPNSSGRKEDSLPPSAALLASRAEGAFLFLSSLLGSRVVGPRGERLGKLSDLLAEDEGTYPRVRALRVKTSVRGPVKRVEWEDVAQCDAGKVVLKRGAESLRELHLPPKEVPLAEDVLDRQIVDTDDAKVERVNDLHLLRARGELRVAHVDVGFRGLVRRMGWQPFVDALVKTVRPDSSYLQREQFVGWKHVKPFAAGSARVRLDVQRTEIALLHPADLAEILSDLDRRERAVLFNELPVASAADALEESEPSLQRELLKMVEPRRAAELLGEMAPDDAADLLETLPEAESQRLLSQMKPNDAREVERLLSYDADTAGGMMSPDFIHLAPTLTVSEALSQVREQAQNISHLHDAFVTSIDGRLAGVLSLRDLLLAKPDALVLGLMHEHPAPLLPDDPAAKVAELAAKYNLFSLPVEDESGKLLGVVTVDDVLEKVLHG
jgi:CBS domain-containing protein